MKKRILAAVTAAMMFTTILSVVPVNTLAIDSAEQSTSAPPSEEEIQLDWLPETEAEYYDFVDEYGHLSVHDYYIVYCDEVNYSTGDEVVVNQSGDGEVKKVKEYTISGDMPAAPGSSSKIVMVYVAVTPGDVQLTISQGRTWDPNAELTEKESGNYVVTDDYTIEEKNKDDILTVSVVDYDTGELILTETDVVWQITLQAGFSVEYVLTDGTFAWGTAWEDLNTWSYGQLNPCEIDTSLHRTGFGVEDFKVVDMYIPKDYFLPEDYLEINYKESDEYHTDFPTDITVKLKKTIMGDVNDDGAFNVSDVVLLQKWLLAVPDTHLANWKAADFCEDDRLDVFDLCLMKRALIEKMNGISQNVDTSFKLQSVGDIRTNGDNHTNWTGYIAR
ncbi:MAG: dockerin type I repeat-containing protein, partial [Ruminococcus sp.]|nr:dockerin type I repeat-containing protein [Ruminococcus sp.]